MVYQLRQVLLSVFSILRSTTFYGLSVLLLVSACEKPRTQSQGLEQPIIGFHQRSFSLARIDSAQSFLDSLRALPKADSLLIQQFLANADPKFIPNEVLDTVTTLHRYGSLQAGGHQAQVIAEITEFNSVTASLHLLLFDKQSRCVATVPLAYYYDEAGARQQWSSTQTSPTAFLQQREISDFVYPQPEQEVMDPIGRETALVRFRITITNAKADTKQIDSTYTVTKY